jgi:hypothetical protein
MAAGDGQPLGAVSDSPTDKGAMGPTGTLRIALSDFGEPSPAFLLDYSVLLQTMRDAVGCVARAKSTAYLSIAHPASGLASIFDDIDILTFNPDCGTIACASGCLRRLVQLVFYFMAR